METNFSAIKKAYENVTFKKQYKYKKRLINAIYVELFLTGCNEVSENEIALFLSQIEKEQKEREQKRYELFFRLTYGEGLSEKEYSEYKNLTV